MNYKKRSQTVKAIIRGKKLGGCVLEDMKFYYKAKDRIVLA